MSLASVGWTSGPSRNRAFRNCAKQPRTILSWASAPLQSTPEQRAAANCRTRRVRDGSSSLEVVAPTAYPRTGLRLCWCRFASPTPPDVSRFSQPPDAFAAPVPAGHYFRPDPLLGFALQSFVPLTQPCAVSGADTLLSLERCRSRHTTANRKRSRPNIAAAQSTDPRLQGVAPRESPPLTKGRFRP